MKDEMIEQARDLSNEGFDPVQFEPSKSKLSVARYFTLLSLSPSERIFRAAL